MYSIKLIVLLDRNLSNGTWALALVIILIYLSLLLSAITIFFGSKIIHAIRLSAVDIQSAHRSGHLYGVIRVIVSQRGFVLALIGRRDKDQSIGVHLIRIEGVVMRPERGFDAVQGEGGT